MTQLTQSLLISTLWTFLLFDWRQTDAIVCYYCDERGENAEELCGNDLNLRSCSYPNCYIQKFTDSGHLTRFVRSCSPANNCQTECVGDFCIYCCTEDGCNGPKNDNRIPQSNNERKTELLTDIFPARLSIPTMCGCGSFTLKAF
eukprot:m.113236 g.113236  ORF g.113236 m.113236 type:complete len:145 (+) comp37450_c0_seq3:61-495(+)